MTEQASSYRKTVVAAVAVTLAAVFAVCVMAWLGVRRAPEMTPLWWIAWGIVTATAILMAKWASLVAAGGFIALRRDALEELGRPYASSARRESVVGPFRSWLFRTLHRSDRPDGKPVARLRLRPGEWVEVRRLDQILQTLDANGTLDGVPFMPEMAAYCGQQVRVFRRADKLNDWIHSAGLKRMQNLVLLEGLRCTGAAHGGCQANCHLRWRESWLRRASPKRTPTPHDASVSGAPDAGLVASCVRDDGTGEPRYVCQATELTAGGTPMSWGDPRHYARDLMYGNLRLGPFVIGVSIACFNWAQRKRGGTAFPSYVCPASKGSPTEMLNLQPGERVRVKPKHEIESTLNAASRNRGLYFDRELLRWCEGEYTVRTRLERVIVEKTGKLLELTTPCIVLEGVTATGEYVGFNSEDEHVFWREIWLERVAGPSHRTAPVHE
ncbi:MAG: hypothetical protein ACREN3_03240 [Gemmatimonadaceae bacterium]